MTNPPTLVSCDGCSILHPQPASAPQVHRVTGPRCQPITPLRRVTRPICQPITFRRTLPFNSIIGRHYHTPIKLASISSAACNSPVGRPGALLLDSIAANQRDRSLQSANQQGPQPPISQSAPIQPPIAQSAPRTHLAGSEIKVN